jgi:putative ABC transport system ATP-binding protein
MTEHLLVADALDKRFGPDTALRGASIRIEAGEIVAVIGPSGCGKSTLLHCLAGIVAPDAGEVRFAGRRIDLLSDRERTALRRESFGFVFQFGRLVPELSALENASLPLLLSGVSRREAESAALEWLERLGVAGSARKRVGRLSGGEAQRVALARAVAHRPRIVFCDEPTGALDSLAGDQVMDLLCDLAEYAETALVLVTHEPRVAARAHREVRMRDGALAMPSRGPLHEALA